MIWDGAAIRVHMVELDHALAERHWENAGTHASQLIKYLESGDMLRYLEAVIDVAESDRRRHL